MKLSMETNDAVRARMIRVDHAGEHGAVRIYDGQNAVFGTLAHKREIAASIAHMAEQEQSHLAAFDELVIARRVRPTALQPLWDVAGFALGAASALMSEGMAMTCTAAVEEEIDSHYARQLKTLAARDNSDDAAGAAALSMLIEKCRTDELAHRETALAAGGETTPVQKMVGEAIRKACRVAISLSERI